jgi:predicted PurR-regulated permease PerM
MRNLEIRLPGMTTPYETIKQQRVLWGCSLVVGFILIYYAGAPIIPVITGCVVVPAMSALRSWLSSRK